MLTGRYITVLLSCLTISTTTLPSNADTPAHHTQSIAVVHVDPVDILTTMKWTAGNFPAGVDAIAADRSSLKVTGTDAGIANVRAAIEAADVEAKNVDIAFQLVVAKRSDIDAFGIDYGNDELPYRQAVGNLVEKMRAQLAVKPNLLSNPSMVIKNGNEASMLISSERFPTMLPLMSMQLNVSPRVNQDGSITLTINPHEKFIGATAVGPVHGSKNVTLTRTVHDGESMVAWDSTGLAGVDGTDNCLLIFLRASVQK